jgi:5-methylcytosine-specific restriction endonuclease McrA
LDVGDTDDIPDHIRRAVILRDKRCQWPGGCDRPAAQCEPHHLRPRFEGGETSMENLDLYCGTHHHHFIHRLGWRIVKHPDGTREAISPRGKVIRSHAPPGASSP